VVPQNPGLLNDSVLQNVRYGREKATDDEIQDACKLVGIHDTIMKLPNGENETKCAEFFLCY
jgi:ABC-type multidrug transport system fused ATPase/permease subunit